MHTIGILVALVILWSFFRRSDKTPSALRESRKTYWQKPNLRRLKYIAAKLDELKTEIEEKVGLDDPGNVASIEEGLIDWEDCVEVGFEEEKKLWYSVKKEADRIDLQIRGLESAHRQKERNNAPLTVSGVGHTDPGLPEFCTERRERLRSAGFPHWNAAASSQWLAAAKTFEDEHNMPWADPHQSENSEQRSNT